MIFFSSQPSSWELSKYSQGLRISLPILTTAQILKLSRYDIFVIFEKFFQKTEINFSNFEAGGCQSTLRGCESRVQF